MRAKVEQMPKIELYRGTKGAKRIFDEIIKDRPKVLDGLVNHTYTAEYLGKEFMFNFINERIKKSIFLKSLRPFGQVCEPEFKSNIDQLREVRCLPKNRGFNSVYYQWNEKVAFVSNKKEGISFVVSSKEFSTLFKELFEILWDGAEKQ